MNSCPSHEFFTTIQRFNSEFAKALEDNAFERERQKRAEARKAAQLLQRNAPKTPSNAPAPATPATTTKGNSLKDIIESLHSGSAFRARLKGTLDVSPGVFTPSPKRYNQTKFILHEPLIDIGPH